MKRNTFNKEEDFVVRESVGLNLITAIFCWIVVISVVLNYSGESAPPEKWISFVAGTIALFGAVAFTSKAIKRKECIRINSDGFYYYRRLITSWRNFDSARITQDDKIITIKDNFVLVLQYSKEEGTFMRKIALTNTQDKSEEEILAAIKFFSEIP